MTEAGRRSGIVIVNAAASIDEIQTAIRQAAAKLVDGR
jgi:hypothetical protein